MPLFVDMQAAPLNPTQALLARIDAKRNLPLGIAAGLVGAIIGGLLWALLVVFTKYEIGFAAIGIAFLVGYGMRTFGNGRTTLFGYVGGAISVFGILFGYVAEFYITVYQDAHTSIASLLSIPLSVVQQGVTSDFGGLDFLFVGFAGYFGYRYSIRTLTKDEVATLRG